MCRDESVTNAPVLGTRFGLIIRPGSENRGVTDKVVANPSSTLLDLDNDPVAEVCGVDNNGRVRGFPTGICKRGHLASAPARNQLQIQRQVVSNVLEQVTAMRSQLEKHESLISRLTSTGGSNMTCGVGPSNMDIRQEFDDGYRPIVEKSCSLYSLRGEHVASGRAITGGPANEQESFEFYEVILDIVFVLSAPSTNMTTLGDEDIGSSIKWPKYFTRFTN
ncbi:hypothetical protein ACHQM5_029436 [Ranunculus cassubicifolius]